MGEGVGVCRVYFRSKAVTKWQNHIYFVYTSYFSLEQILIKWKVSILLAGWFGSSIFLAEKMLWLVLNVEEWTNVEVCPLLSCTLIKVWVLMGHPIDCSMIFFIKYPKYKSYSNYICFQPNVIILCWIIRNKEINPLTNSCQRRRVPWGPNQHSIYISSESICIFCRLLFDFYLFV